MGRFASTGAPEAADRQLPWLDEDEPNPPAEERPQPPREPAKATSDAPADLRESRDADPREMREADLRDTRDADLSETRDADLRDTRDATGGAFEGSDATGGVPEEREATDVLPAADRRSLAPVTAPVPPLGPPPPPPAVPGLTPGPTPRRRVRAWVAILVVVVVIALAVATVLLAVLDAGDRSEPGPGRAVGDAAGDHAVSAPLGGRQQASFDLVSGVATVNVRAADLGDRLYRVATPDESGIVPKVLDQSGRLNLQLVDTGQPGPASVDIQLSSRVRWNLRMTGGATEHIVDLRGASLLGVEFVGGATRIELSLPRPQGTVPVRMSGGASQFVVHAPAGIPVRVRLGNGAGNVAVDGVRHSGISAGTVYTPDNWTRSSDRYDIDAAAGLAQLTVDRG